MSIELNKGTSTIFSYDIIMSIMKYTGAEYVSIYEYNTVVKKLKEKIENSSLSRRYKLCFDQNDDFEDIVSQSLGTLYTSEDKEIIFLNNDIKSNTQFRGYRIDLSVERVLDEIYNSAKPIKKYIDPNLMVSLDVLYPTLSNGLKLSKN